MYDISPDGRSGVVPTERTYADEFETSRIHVILNWLRP
jgi:hypothetical protein